MRTSTFIIGIVMALTIPIVSIGQNVLLVTQTTAFSSFNEFPSAGWDANVNVSIFDQKFESALRKAPADNDFKNLSGVIYILNYPLGSQEFSISMCQLTMQTLHKIYAFVENGGNAIILMNNERLLKYDEFKSYLKDKFALISNTQWYGSDNGGVIAKFPINGELLHKDLSGLKIGGCKGSPNLMGWYIPKPGYWEGIPVGEYTPNRFTSLQRVIGTGRIVFTVDCDYDSVFSDRFIGTFDNYQAAVRLLKWLAN